MTPKTKIKLSLMGDKGGNTARFIYYMTVPDIKLSLPRQKCLTLKPVNR